MVQQTTLTHVENLIGSDYDDVLTGDSGDNLLMGGLGSDALDGGAGDDRLVGGAGDDTLAGGTGSDWVSYADVADNGTFTGVTIDLNLAEQDTVRAGTDMLTGIEHVEGTEFDDTLTGDDGGNMFYGLGGDDTISGGGVNDFIQGGGGDDTLDGGDGIDFVSYYDVPDDGTVIGVQVDLSDTEEQDTVRAGLDTLSNFENIVGSKFNDTLTGTTGDNIIVGGGGDDDYYGGGGGDDTFLNGAGNARYDWSGSDSATVITNSDITLSENVLLAGNVTIIATGTLTVASGVTISSRSIDGTDYLTGTSNAASGDIILQAQGIIIESGASILAHADGGFQAGDIDILAYDTFDISWINDSAPDETVGGG